MVSTTIFNGKKNAVISQKMEIKKIPERSFEEIPSKKFPNNFSQIVPKPAITGRISISENNIYSIKKDCLKVSNLLILFYTFLLLNKI